MKNFISRIKSGKLVSVACVLAALAFLVVFYGLAAKNTPESTALSALSDFKAGRIVDDEIFYNPNTMTVTEIQAHLDRYSASCDMWGEQKIGSGRSINGKAVDPNITRREYARLMREAGRSDYHDAPYVCISKYYENPTTHKTNFDTNAVAEAGMISAAQIIYNAAHQYNINPQVLLVMLKKESYVWGDTWPLKNEYNTVMGYACPDNAPCDAQYFGFYNQVMKAAWQLNYYKEHIYSYGYYPYMTNNIYYSPTYSCGTKAVYLENLATTSLYIYTPYTPNDAALAAYPGEAYCGSYGNRNFFMFFNEWFGSSLKTKEEQKIDARYDELKKAGVNLGNKLTEHANCNIGHEGACVQAYENGNVIIYSPKYGAWENTGEIRKRFVELGSVDGVLGFPTGPVNCNIGHDGSCVQSYENGVIIYSPKYGAWEQYGEIRKKFIELGSVDGNLGFPVSEVVIDKDSYSQKFENGVIVKGSNGKYYSVFGGIFKKFSDDTSATGMPTMEANCNIGHTDACVQVFDNDVIIYSPESGAFNNNGIIRERFTSIGSVDSVLGFPISDISKTADSGLVQKYQNGLIYANSNGDTFVVKGEIYKKYSEDIDFYGYPVIDENDKIGSSSSVQVFTSGAAIIYSPKFGTWENYGPIRERLTLLNSVHGVMGYPVGPVNCSIGHDGACVQAFENGVIIYSQKYGAWEQYGGIRSEYVKLKSVDGKLGFPTSGINPSAYVDNVIYQHFENGTIYYTITNGYTWEIYF